MVGIAAGVVVGVADVVSAVVEVFLGGFLSLLNISSLSLPPNSLFHGIFPRMTLEAVVVVVVVEADVFLSIKNGSIVGSNSGASAEVM